MKHFFDFLNNVLDKITQLILLLLFTEEGWFLIIVIIAILTSVNL
jgi:hypothetical protein